MKLQIIFLLLFSFIYISKCQNIVSPTNYTLSYLESIDMRKMKCTSDKDCPQYSKCNNSICKFGDFLCPEPTDGYLMSLNIDPLCVYVDATKYDLDKEEVKKGTSKDIKPILKTCGFVYKIHCTTEKCNKNSDCLSGMCLNHICMNGDNLNYQIYRCSLDGDQNYSMKCKKVNGMRCGNDSECYSNTCTSGDGNNKKYIIPKYCSKTSYTSTVFKNVLIGFGILIGMIIVFLLIYCITMYFKNR